MEFLAEFGYLGLFIAAFLAATILPLGSELVLTALLVSGLSPWPLVIIASLGNVLGSLTNYLLGYWASQGRVQRWLNISDQALAKAEARFKRYGLASLCFAWVPLIGDPLTLIAGVLRVNLIWFVLLVSVGKIGRYIAVAYYWL